MSKELYIFSALSDYLVISTSAFAAQYLIPADGIEGLGYDYPGTEIAQEPDPNFDGWAILSSMLPATSLEYNSLRKPLH